MLPQHEGFNHQSLDKFNQSLEACGDSSSGDLTALKLGLPLHRGGGNNQQSTSNQMFINRWLKGDNHHLTFHLCSFEHSCSQQFINIGIQQVQIDGPVKVRKFHPQDFLEKKHSKSWKKGLGLWILVTVTFLDIASTWVANRIDCLQTRLPMPFQYIFALAAGKLLGVASQRCGACLLLSSSCYLLQVSLGVDKGWRPAMFVGWETFVTV